MATVDSLIRDILGSHGISEAAPIAVTWINNKYQELALMQLRHLRHVGELGVPAVVSTGTVSVTRGSTAVTGLLTTFVTEVGSGAQEYWYFRTSSAWYKVATIGGETALTLASAFAEDDVSGGSYQLVKRFHALGASARWLRAVVHTRLRRRLNLISQDEMDYRFPGRLHTGIYPSFVSHVGFTAADIMEVEVYPPPVTSEILHYVYYNFAPTLTIASSIPAELDTFLLKEGVLVDLYRYLAARAAQSGKIEVAAYWRNEARAQETAWSDKKKSVKLTRGVDDLAFVLERFGGAGLPPYDQRTAHDIVLDRWNWPA